MNKDLYQNTPLWNVRSPGIKKKSFKEKKYPQKTNQITHRVLRIRMADMSTAILEAKNNGTRPTKF